jgi:hypothetical protein
MLAVRRPPSKIFDNERLRDADMKPPIHPERNKKALFTRQTLSCNCRASMAAGDLELEQLKRLGWNDFEQILESI